MSVFGGDFLGFQIGDIHSEQLNITRVSTSDRYMDSLVPNFSDTTATISGRDGTFYWNTYYTQKPFQIDFAFDDLRDEDIRRLRQELGFKGVKQLIFDEEPYKKYMVKCSAPPTLKYIAFDHGEVRVYKGEGTVNLVAYYPYALSTEETVINVKASSRRLQNLGDLDAPFKILFEITTSLTDINLRLTTNESIVADRKTLGRLKLTGITQKKDTDKYICIDSRTNLIEGLDSDYNKTSTLYNSCITIGDFFLLPPGETIIDSNSVKWHKIQYHALYY